MAGYSGTPLAKKLGIKDGGVVTALHLPAGGIAGLSLAEGLGEPRYDVIVAFYTRRSELEAEVDALGERIRPDGALWVCWPKKASKVPTDIVEDHIRAIVLPKGLVDNKVCAVDERWSGLRIVWRRENR